jgi:hypothetical protein
MAQQTVARELRGMASFSAASRLCRVGQLEKPNLTDCGFGYPTSNLW